MSERTKIETSAALAALPYGTPLRGNYGSNFYADGKGGVFDCWGQVPDRNHGFPLYVEDANEAPRLALRHMQQYWAEHLKANALEMRLMDLLHVRDQLSIVSDRLVVVERRAQEARTAVDALQALLDRVDNVPD